MVDFTAQRQHMIDGQLKPNRITDPALLEIMARIPREDFIPQERRQLAYLDAMIPLGHHRFLLPPLVLARLIQSLAIKAGDKILEIACASGYASQILLDMQAELVAIEQESYWLQQCRQNLKNPQSVKLLTADLQQGAPDFAPYDAILIAAAIPAIPAPIAAQLRDGGKIATVIRQPNAVIGQQVIGIKAAGQIGLRPVADVNLPILPEFTPSETFAW